MDFSVPVEFRNFFGRLMDLVEYGVPGAVQYAFLPFFVIVVLILLFRNTH